MIGAKKVISVGFRLKPVTTWHLKFVMKLLGKYYKYSISQVTNIDNMGSWSMPKIDS